MLWLSSRIRSERMHTSWISHEPIEINGGDEGFVETSVQQRVTHSFREHLEPLCFRLSRPRLPETCGHPGLRHQ